MKAFNNCIHKIIQWTGESTKAPREFLQAGSALGKVLCALLAAQFISEGVMRDLFLHITRVGVFVITLCIVVVACELITLILRLLLGVGRTGRIYTYVAFGSVTAINYFATGGMALPAVIMMSLCVAVSADLLGRCVLAFIRRRNWNYAFGYIVLLVSLAYLGFYGYFCHTDNFGQDRVALYMKNEPENLSGMVDGFQEYLGNGDEEVGILTYGPGTEYDIATKNVDLTSIVERKGIVEKFLDITCGKDFAETPVSGIIYYPVNTYSCPTLFMVHGAHSADTPSYLGYDYLGEYLASNGYVVVSVDENIINEMNESNDIRAILLLENMKTILDENQNSDGMMYGRIDSERLALGGHSRGGEMVSTAYLFNDLATYPENGNVEFDYNFNISAIVAIAPTVDQYMPSDHSVVIEDVDYLLLHGANDQDVHSVMGEKQYSNVVFTGGSGRVNTKASVYILGANHGQFNTRWGRYDLTPGMNVFLNTAHFITADEQQRIAKAYIRTFLDMSLKGDMTYSDLLKDNEKYANDLPQTVYITNYKDSKAVEISYFEDAVDLESLDINGVTIRCDDMREWKIGSSVYGNGRDEENYILQCEWNRNSNPRIDIDFRAVNLEDEYIAFRIKDMVGGDKNRIDGINYSIELSDVLGHSVSVDEPEHIYPKIGIQLYKQDVLSGNYEYKHQFQTVIISRKLFEDNEEFDFGNVVHMSIVLDGEKKGRVYLDDIFTAENIMH